jgi:hypothetical protein
MRYEYFVDDGAIDFYQPAPLKVVRSIGATFHGNCRPRAKAAFLRNPNMIMRCFLRAFPQLGCQDRTYRPWTSCRGESWQPRGYWVKAKAGKRSPAR